MRKIVAALVCFFALTAASCSTAQIQKFETAINIVKSAQVPAEYIIAAAYAFNTVKIGATQYLVYCKGHLSQSICSASNRRFVINWTRKGTQSRNSLEASIADGQAAGPRALYDALIAATQNLSTSPAQEFITQAQSQPSVPAIGAPVLQQ